MKKPSKEFAAKVRRFEQGDRNAFAGCTAIEVALFPRDGDSPEVMGVRRAAAKWAKARDGAVRARAFRRLADVMETLPMERLNYWARLDLIAMGNGATGEGGFWASATEAANRAAILILRGRPAFVIE